jgi:hypothetical protein
MQALVVEVRSPRAGTQRQLPADSADPKFQHLNTADLVTGFISRNS